MMCDRRTDGWTDGRTGRPTEKVTYRGGCPACKPATFLKRDSNTGVFQWNL